MLQPETFFACSSSRPNATISPTTSGRLAAAATYANRTKCTPTAMPLLCFVKQHKFSSCDSLAFCFYSSFLPWAHNHAKIALVSTRHWCVPLREGGREPRWRSSEEGEERMRRRRRRKPSAFRADSMTPSSLAFAPSLAITRQQTDACLPFR